ncbi:unnamed protein product, partial [Closterium sp. NIES-53]
SRSSLPTVPDPESDHAHAASPTVSHLLAIVVTHPSFESTAASALVAELLDFAAACHLDYATALLAESESASPPSVGGECALGTEVLQDRQDDFECLAAAVPRFTSMMLAPEGDPDAPDIPAPRSYAEAITGLGFSCLCSRFVCGQALRPRYSLRLPCFSPDASGWQFYHPTSRRVFPSQDVTFDESLPFYRVFPYRSAPPPPPLLFLALGPPPVDPLPPQGPTPSGVSQVDPLPGTVPVEVAVDSGAARGAAFGGAASGGVEPGGAKPGGAEPGGAESEGAGSRGAEPGGAQPGGAKPAGVESGGAEPEGVEPGGAEFRDAKPRGTASSGGPAGDSPQLSPRPEPLSPQQLRKWFTQCTRLRTGAPSAGDSAAGDTGVGGAGVTAGAGGTGGAAAAGPRGARTRGTGAAGTGSVGDAGAGDSTGPGAAGAGGTGVGGTGACAGAGGAGAVDPGAGGAGAGSAMSGGTGAGGTVRPRPYFVSLLQQVLGVPSSLGLTPPLLCPPPDHSQPLLQPASALPAPTPYTAQAGGLTDIMSLRLVLPPLFVLVVVLLICVLLLSQEPMLWHFVLPLFQCVFLDLVPAALLS